MKRTNKRGSTDFVKCKLVIAWYRCQLRIRYSVYIIQIVEEALYEHGWAKKEQNRWKPIFTIMCPKWLLSTGLRNYYLVWMWDVSKLSGYPLLFHLDKRNNFLQFRNLKALRAKKKYKQYQTSIKGKYQKVLCHDSAKCLPFWMEIGCFRTIGWKRIVTLCI